MEWQRDFEHCSIEEVQRRPLVLTKLSYSVTADRASAAEQKLESVWCLESFEAVDSEDQMHPDAEISQTKNVRKGMSRMWNCCLDELRSNKRLEQRPQTDVSD